MTIGARDQGLKSCKMVGDRIKEVIGDRIKEKIRENKQEEKRRRELRMSDDHSDVGAMEHEADHADITDDGEVELNLPQETVEEQIRTSEDIRKLPGAINPGTMALDLEARHRFESRNGA